MSEAYELRRNTTEGFARRIRKNLEFIISERRRGADVHEVTQLTTSLLGLIVFPWESHALGIMNSWRLSELESKGWPSWTILKDRDGHPWQVDVSPPECCLASSH